MTQSIAPAALLQDPLDAVRLELARLTAEALEEELGALLELGANALSASGAVVWVAPEGAWSAAARRGEGAPRAPDSALLAARRAVAADGALSAGIWVDGALRGAVALQRPGDWTPAEGALAAALADRAALALAREDGRAALRTRERKVAEVEALAGIGSWEQVLSPGLADGPIRWSPGLLRLHGRRPEDAPATFGDFLEMVHPADRDAVTAASRGVRETRQPAELVVRMLGPDGEVRHVHSRAHLVEEEGGRLRMFGTSQDVTELTRARAALAAREAQLSEAQQIAGLGSWEWDIPADRITWSDQQFRLHGREPQAAVTFDWFFAHVHPDDRGWMGETMSRAIAEGGAFDFEYRIVRGDDGQARWLRARGRMELDPEGRPARMVGTSEDVHEARAAREALRESEARFRDIFRFSNDAIFITDPDSSEILDANPRACEMCATTVAELRAGPAGIIWNGPPPFTPERARELGRRAAEGEPQRFEWMSIHPRSGEPIWGDVSLQRVELGGQPRILALVRDIGDRKRVEEALRQSEQSYRAIFDASSDAIYVHDLETGAILEANRAACETNGQTLDEMRARGLELIGHGPPPFSPELALEHIRRAAAGQPQRFEWCTYHHQTGEEMWVEVSLQRVAMRGVERLLAMVRDIRERKRAEAALRASEESYRTIFQSSSDGIWLHDLATGEVLDVNAAAAELHGYTLAEMRALPHDALIFPGSEFTAERVAGYLARAAAGEQPRFEWMNRHASGRPVWAEVTLRRVGIGGADRILATARDIGERKAAEQALRESEENYRTIFNAAGAAIWLHDLETGAFIDVNQGACDLYGWSVEEQKAMGVEGISWGEPPFTAGDARALIQRAVAGTPQTFEWLGRHKSGRGIWAEITLRRVTINGVDRLLATARDITDRKTAEAALRRANEALERRVEERTAEIAAQKEFFERVLDGLDAGVAVFDAEGRYQYISQRAVPNRELREWMIGHTLEEYGAYWGVDPEIVRARRRLVADAIAGVRTTELEELLPATAERGPMQVLRRCVPLTDAEGRVLRVVGYSVDITERKRAEEALRRSEEHFRALIENGGDYLMIVDATGAITYVGPSVERILGYTPDEMLGKRPADLVHPDDVTQVMTVLRDIVDHPGTMRTVEYRIRHRDGSYRVMENVGKTLSPVTAEAGVVSNGRDITERKRTEQALRRATEEAERANRAKSEFLSRMSHELRTPMNSILGFAQLLARAELAAEHQKGVQHILKAGRHLLSLINEVLEISRIEAGRQTLSLEPVRVGTVVQEALGLVRPLAAQLGVTLNDAVEPDLAARFVQADRQRLSQVLLNLLSNAIKYNRPGGVVRIGCTGDARVLTLRVTDSGPGIPADRLDQLFIPFSRLGAEQGEVEGTGLGLALSQRLVEAMGGALSLDSTGPGGSTFRVDLSTAADPRTALEAPPAAQAVGEAPGHRPATLLYVEDNLDNLCLVESILAARPRWRVLPALQGQLGLELAREHRPDLVLLDLHLPDLNGQEVLRRLRADARTAHIPVVVVSADATPLMLERLLEAGADGYLTKPLDIDEFLATADRFLEDPS